MAPKLAGNAGFKFYPHVGVSAPFDARHDFVTSPVLPPLALAAVRLTLGTYALVVLLYQLIYEAVRTHDVDGCVDLLPLLIPLPCAHAPTKAHVLPRK